MTRSLQRYILCSVTGVLLAGLTTPAHAQDCDPVEVAKLLASDGEAGDRFGGSVSVIGDTAVFGSWGDDDNGESSGSVYVFIRSGGVWTQQAKLLPTDGAEGDHFGRSISSSGDTVIIGAPNDDDNDTDSGSVYVFTRSGGVWAQQAKLIASDGAAYDFFGEAVTLSGDIAIIGAWADDDNDTDSGSAYVFMRSSGVWTQQAKLRPADGAASDEFGRFISNNGNTVVIGSYKDDDNGTDSGAAYVFTQDGSVWTQQTKLLPDDGAEDDWFGFSVSISGDTVIIGAVWDDDNGPASGSAYVFKQNGGVWMQQAKLLPHDGAAINFFGNSASLSSNTVIIGADGDNRNGSRSGAAYVFSRNGDIWTEQTKLLPGDGAMREQFGFSVSLSINTAIIGAYRDNDNGPSSGSAYVFDLHCIDCPADLNGDGIIDTRDFIAFLGAWASGDPLADWNDDGDINTLDFIAYLTDWTAGC